jgi:NADPH:quinone reductase-like Zn-dependent oxidoreductase
MKAIALQKDFVKHISDLAVSDVPAPTSSSSEILVNIAYAAIQHVDLLYARGLHQNNHIGLVAPPFILGLEYSGVVASAPAGSKFKKGDRVFGGGVGAFAEQYVAKESQLSLVPESWSLREAAGVGSAAHVSYGAIIRCGQLRPGETILIHAAAGGLGIMACQIALAIGARVIATVGSTAKMDVVRRLGVRDVISYDTEGWEKEVLKLADGKGVDLVYDTVGLVQKSISCTRFRGRVVIAGFAGRGGEMEKLAMNRVLLKNVQLLGYRYGETGRRDPAENVLVSEDVARMIKEGAIKPVIYDEVYEGLESVPRALADSASRKIWGKGVVDVQPHLDQRRSKL